MEEKRVVIYARKSKFKETSESCTNQINMCKNKIAYMNTDPASEGKTIYTVVKEFTDEGFSGKSFDRPDMQKLIGMIEENKVDVIFVYKLDRLSRSVRDIFNFIHFLQEYNVDIVSVKEREIDTTTATGKAFFAINMVFAQLERDLASERSKDNNMELARKGQFMGSYVKYGFTAIKEQIGGREAEKGKTKTLLTWNNEEANIVKSVFSMYLEGNYSYARISDILNENGVPKKVEWNQPNKNEKWFETNIRNMLNDINYCQNSIEAYNYFKKQSCEFLVPIEKFDGKKSLQKYDGKITILNVEPIISSKDFIKVQKMKDSKKTTRNHTLPYESEVMLGSGILICHKCGKHLGNTIKKSAKKEYGYYHCYNKECSEYLKMKHIKLDILDNNVLDRLKKFYNNKDLIKKVLEADIQKRSQVSEEEAKMNQIMKQIEGLDRMIENMNTAISNLSAQEDEDVNVLISNYQINQISAIKKKKELKKELEQLNLEHQEEEERFYDINELLEAVDDFAEVLDKATAENRKKIVHFLVKSIIVRSDKDFDLNLYFYEDLPDFKDIDMLSNNEFTPQGVRWKKV